MELAKNGAYVRINTVYPSFLPAEKRIADYILKNANETPALSIGELAQLSGTSKATVTRFCKRLGYSGFKDFRVSAIKDTHMGLAKKANPSYKYAKTMEQALDSICESNAQACADTRLLLDINALEKAAKMIARQKRVIFVGEGAISAVMLDLYQKMLRLGVIGAFSFDQRLQKMHISLSGKDDLVVAVDLTGNKRSTVEMVQKALANGAQVISICNSIGSALAKAGGINLFGSGRMGSSVSATLAPRISLLCVVDCLFAVLEKQMGKKGFDNLKKTNKVIVDDWI